MSLHFNAQCLYHFQIENALHWQRKVAIKWLRVCKTTTHTIHNSVCDTFLRYKYRLSKKKAFWLIGCDVYPLVVIVFLSDLRLSIFFADE